MLKELFESRFYQIFPKVEGRTVNLIEKTAVGTFSLLDDKACQGCKYVCSSDISLREQLKVKSNQSVSYISIDQVVSYVKDSVGKTCDYMLDSNDSVALVEMTCSTSDYVVDKRSTARKQLYNTIALLSNCPQVKVYINRKTKNYAIFSWKETFDSSIKSDEVEDMMTGMFAMADAVYSPDNESNFDFDFKFKEIRYPHVLSL